MDTFGHGDTMRKLAIILSYAAPIIAAIGVIALMA